MEKFHMVGGDDEASYLKNSSIQRQVLREVKPMITKCIEELFGDLGNDLPNCIIVADLGCSSGPNLFETAQHILECIGTAYQMIRNDRDDIQIQYFLNDLVPNDFNLVFKGLPEFYHKLEKDNSGRKCFFIAAMPGSFYGKLFPDGSMHFQHSSYCLHWLSQVPKGLVLGSDDSSQAYLDQFTQDFGVFLKMRSQELVQYGQLLLTLLCKNEEDQDLLGMTLREMVAQGELEEDKLDSFNLPFYAPSVHETKQVIENEGSFQIQKIHTFRTPGDGNYKPISHGGGDDDAKNRAIYVTAQFRAVHQPILETHFGKNLMDNLFRRYANKLVSCIQLGRCFHNCLVISLRRR